MEVRSIPMIVSLPMMIAFPDPRIHASQWRMTGKVFKMFFQDYEPKEENPSTDRN
jgi:hypothetical protein